jgi:hypothetical protein
LDFNETHRGLSFGDSSFLSLAQKVTCHPDPVPRGNVPNALVDLFHDSVEIPIDEPVFHDSFTDTFPDGGYFFDPQTPLLTWYSSALLSI